MMPEWLQAWMWGTIAGGALVVGCGLAWKWKIPSKVVSSVMSFGAGVLISALAFGLVQEAVHGGLYPTIGGFATGAVVYVAANAVLAFKGAKHRKRSGGKQPSEQQKPGSGTAIAIGALLDGIPESVVLGVGLVTAGAVSPAVLAAVFISNVPEGLSSTAGMKKAGRSAKYVFGVWVGIAVVSGLAALVGFLVLQDAPAEIVAFITAVAAGAILAMLADTMIPEAFEEHHILTGLIAAVGFLAAFTVDQVGG